MINRTVRNFVAAFIVAVIALVGLNVVVARAATKSNPHATYALGHAKHCRADFVKRTLRHKVRGKEVRYVACVYVAPRLALTAPGSTSTSGGAVVTSGSSGNVQTPTGSAQLRANIDPSYTQNPNNGLDATFTYSAGVTDGSLPSGVLDLYWGTSAQSQTLACSLNVGGNVSGGTCEVVFPAYGQEFITVQYTSGSASATQTDIEDIENPSPPPRQVLSTSTVLNIGALDSYANTPVGSTVTDSLGTVTTGTVSYQLTFWWSGHSQSTGVLPIVGAAGATCIINVVELSQGSYNDYAVSSSNCSGGGTLIASSRGTAPPDSVTVQGAYSGAQYDTASNSASQNFPW